MATPIADETMLQVSAKNAAFLVDSGALGAYVAPIWNGLDAIDENGGLNRDSGCAHRLQKELRGGT